MNFIAFSPGPFEIVVILVVMLLLFGKRLPDVGRSLGKGLVEFKKGVKGVEKQIDIDVDGEAQKQLDDEEKIIANVTNANICANCGNKNEKDAAFCSTCGSRMD